MGHAELRCLCARVVPISFSGLVAQPSMGKTAAMRFTQSAIETVERFFEVPLQQSQQCNAPTIEGLLDLLKAIPCVSGKSCSLNPLNFNTKKSYFKFRYSLAR
jgi:hypothetical protein